MSYEGIEEGYKEKTGVSAKVNLDDALDNLLKTSEMESIQKVHRY